MLSLLVVKAASLIVLLPEGPGRCPVVSYNLQASSGRGFQGFNSVIMPVPWGMELAELGLILRIRNQVTSLKRQQNLLPMT